MKYIFFFCRGRSVPVQLPVMSAEPLASLGLVLPPGSISFPESLDGLDKRSRVRCGTCVTLSHQLRDRATQELQQPQESSLLLLYLLLCFLPVGGALLGARTAPLASLALLRRLRQGVVACRSPERPPRSSARLRRVGSTSVKRKQQPVSLAGLPERVVPSLWPVGALCSYTPCSSGRLSRTLTL